MGSLKDKLAAAQAQKSQATNTAAPKRTAPKQKLQEAFIDTDISSLDDMVFGLPSQTDDSQLYESYPNGQKRKIYDPEEEMREIRNNGGNITVNENSHLPKAILAELMRNPLDVQPIGEEETQALSEGVANRTLDILDKLESRDKKGKVSNNQDSYTQPLNEASDNGLYNNSYQANDLAQLIESIIDKKFKQYGGTIINEARKAGNVPSMNMMKIGESFMFMDSENNVYECKLTRIGKGKMKQK